MHSTSNPSEKRGRRTSYRLTLLLGWIYCVTAQVQLLETIPADVAAVTVVRSPREFLKKANAALAKLSPDAKPIEWSDIERKLGPAAAGFCDLDQPLVVVLTRAEGEGGTLVVGSRVKPPKAEKASGEPERFFAQAGNMTFVSPRRRPLRSFTRLRSGLSLAAAMDPQDRAVARSSDVFVYIRMEAWQERIRPYVQLYSTFAKFSVTAEPSDNKTEQKMRSEVTNWFIDGAVSVLDQMQSVSLGLTLDDESIRLRHHHHFVPGGTVAGYLSKVRVSNEPPWACLPDRPFLAAFATQWWSPEQSSIVCAMTRKVFDAVSDGEGISTEARKKLIDASGACYAGMRGMNLLMTQDASADGHLEFYGSYAFEDAEAGLRQMRVIQANASEALAAITPGGFVGSGKDLTRDGVHFNEVELDVSVGGAAEFKEEMDQVYGPNAKVRQARVGKTRVVSCINQSADEFVKLVKAGEKDQPLLNNKRIKKLMHDMQPKAQAWLMLDLKRLTDLAASVVVSQTDDTAKVPAIAKKTRANRGEREVGPLLGWSGQAGDRFFSGEFYMSLDDAATAVRLTTQMVDRFRDEYGTPPAK